MPSIPAEMILKVYSWPSRERYSAGAQRDVVSQVPDRRRYRNTYSSEDTTEYNIYRIGYNRIQYIYVYV